MEEGVQRPERDQAQAPEDARRRKPGLKPIVADLALDEQTLQEHFKVTVRRGAGRRCHSHPAGISLAVTGKGKRHLEAAEIGLRRLRDAREADKLANRRTCAAPALTPDLQRPVGQEPAVALLRDSRIGRAGTWKRINLFTLETWRSDRFQMSALVMGPCRANGVTSEA